MKLRFLDTMGTSLKRWAETRWDSRWSSINSIIQNYSALLICLKELESEGTDRSVDAKGLLLVIRESKFLATLSILHKVLGIIKILSDQLKGNALAILLNTLPVPVFTAKATDFSRAQHLIQSVISQIAELRDDQSFSAMYERLLMFCKDNSIGMME